VHACSNAIVCAAIIASNFALVVVLQPAGGKSVGNGFAELVDTRGCIDSSQCIEGSE
jgi:hypothetical protein